jgi:hypothetical protein
MRHELAFREARLRVVRYRFGGFSVVAFGEEYLATLAAEPSDLSSRRQLIAGFFV